MTIREWFDSVGIQLDAGNVEVTHRGRIEFRGRKKELMEYGELYDFEADKFIMKSNGDVCFELSDDN